MIHEKNLRKKSLCCLLYSFESFDQKLPYMAGLHQIAKGKTKQKLCFKTILQQVCSISATFLSRLCFVAGFRELRRFSD